MRMENPLARLRVLLLTNEETANGHQPGHREALASLLEEGRIEAFAWAAPLFIAKSKGGEGALREVLEVVRAMRPNVIIQDTPRGFPFTDEWFRALGDGNSRPILLFWEGDPWGRWSKPATPDVRLWWKNADVVFTVAIGRQRSYIERLGGQDVRFAPHTYDHIRFGAEEASEPPMNGDYTEVVVVAHWWGNRYFYSRLPGARQRYRLVRGLQKDTGIPLAIYGRNWNGRGTKGEVLDVKQAAAARNAFITANWDHFPDYPAYASNRLPIQLLAGRCHVTTLHPQMEWLPGPETGLFLEATVDAVINRVRELLARPREEVFELGLAAHRWVRHRLSDRELARFMLGAVDERLLGDLPDDPWSQLPA